jgi:hypothetical protein
VSDTFNAGEIAQCHPDKVSAAFTLANPDPTPQPGAIKVSDTFFSTDQAGAKKGSDPFFIAA